MTVEVRRLHLGPKFSEGARLLWKVVTDLGSQGAAMRELGCATGMLSRWLYGDQTPRLTWLVRIRDAFGIPIEAWQQAPKRKFQVPALRAANAARKHAA
jgi:hypothetical protein